LLDPPVFYVRQLRSNLFGPTISLLKLSEKVNEPGGDGLSKIVFCAKITPDGCLNLNKVPH
jgi:hypothetical protein